MYARWPPDRFLARCSLDPHSLYLSSRLRAEATTASTTVCYVYRAVDDVGRISGFNRSERVYKEEREKSKVELCSLGICFVIVWEWRGGVLEE